jgi:ElaB/YqjD/DUF883 family membrane-anchored ribosome-binding protein
MAENPELAQVYEQLQKLRADAARLSEILVAAGCGEAETLKKHSFERMREAAAALRSGKQCCCETVESLESGVRKYPIFSITAMFGCGYIIGKILGRR